MKRRALPRVSQERAISLSRARDAASALGGNTRHRGRSRFFDLPGQGVGAAERGALKGGSEVWSLSARDVVEPTGALPS